MKTERHNVAGRMIFKAFSKGPWGAGLVNTDKGSDDNLQIPAHNLQIPAHASNRIIPLYLYPRNFPKRFRLTSSRPDAILTTPYQANPTPSCLSWNNPKSTLRHQINVSKSHTGTVYTQKHGIRFNMFSTSARCPLCTEMGTINHITLRCLSKGRYGPSLNSMDA
eukprot:1136683-Pelagomonas_calceolata.AAC.1